LDKKLIALGMSDKYLLNQHSLILNEHTGILKETNENLKHFVDVSINQFEQQQKFKERFISSIDQLNERFSESLDQQNKFNERFLNNLEDIEKALKK
jgi:hypothetical protein